MYSHRGWLIVFAKWEMLITYQLYIQEPNKSTSKNIKVKYSSSLFRINMRAIRPLRD